MYYFSEMNIQSKTANRPVNDCSALSFKKISWNKDKVLKKSQQETSIESSMTKMIDYHFYKSKDLKVHLKDAHLFKTLSVTYIQIERNTRFTDSA